MFRFLTSGRDRDRNGGERESSNSSSSRSSSLGSPATGAGGSRRRPQPSHPALEAVAASEVADGAATGEDEVRLRRRRRKVNLSASQQSKKSGAVAQGKLPDDRPGGANSPSPAATDPRPSFVVGSRPSSVDTTASGTTAGADDERDYEDLEVDESEAEFEAELALLNRSRSSRSEPDLVKPPATTSASSAISAFSHVISSAPSTALAMAHPNTPTTSTSASSVATTPQPHLINNVEEMAASEAEAEEAHDEFCVNAPGPSPQPAKSLPYHRPVPVLHHFSLAPPPKGHPHKGAFHHLQINSGGIRPMPSPVQTPTSQPQSLQLVPGEDAKNGSADQQSSSNAMSRSISDSTLRRAALHLNLNNQSVLPSFTSLQQFKKELSLTSSSRRPSTRGHRKSMIATTSPTLPRCHSPSVAAAQMVSPMDSPKVSPNQFAFANIKKADGRRWSVASLPSSGYGTTPGSSNVSSQCSSQERLHQLGAAAAPGHHHHHHHHHAAAAAIAAAAPAAPVPAASSIASTPASAVPGDELRSMHRHFSSNESNPSLLEDDPGGRRSPSIRPRSRSLSSPVRSPVVGGDSEIVLIATLYKERFPKATKQMEERLQNFISSNETLSSTSSDIAADSVAIVRFVHHQVLEMARDCLQKSEDKLITSRYFYEMSENLEKLLIQTREKSTEAASHLTALIKKLLLIVSRPARLLECLEFDPEEFLQLLDAAEGHARGLHGVNANVPQYIISKLGLNRDPLAELRQDMSQLDTKGTSNNSDSNVIPPVEVVVEGDEDEDHRPRHSSTPKKDDEEESREEGASPSPMSKKPSFKDPSDNDFEELKLISNGAYGAVYLVKHKETRQRFALKKINKQNLILRNQVDQVFAERDIMSFTDNPFVVSMFCSFETRKHLCMVMEYVEGGDCANLLKGMGPFPPDMARLYFTETVLAVEYLHSFGIVHRDLKPDNLLITALGHIKLTDFGLSKMGLMSLATNLYEGYIDKETKQFSDKQVFGTPEYIAPEVILRQGYGKPVDWWSMGIILYEFLIGCVPFFGDTPEELFAHTVNDDIEWPTEEDWPVPPEAKEIISALLMQNPLDRLGTAGSFDVKEHHYFFGVDWNSLLRMKADFIPQLEDEEDISYFDSRLERYNHEMEQEDDSTNNRSSAEDTDDTQSMFASFTSASPRYRKATHGGGAKDPSLISHRHSMSVCESTPGTPVSTSTGEHSKVLSPELRRCQQQHIGRPEVGNIDSRTLSASSSNSSSKTEISSASGSAHLSCPDLEIMVAKAQSQSPVPDPVPNRALPPPPPSRQSSAPQSLSLTDSSQTESEDMSPLMTRRRKLHSGRDSHHSSGSNSPLPKFSISGEGPQLLQLGAVPKSPLPVESSTGPRSLPVTPKLSVQPTTPSPLVTGGSGGGGGARQKSLSVSQAAAAAAALSLSSSSRPQQMVKSSSATGLSLMIPADSAAAAAMAAAQSIQSPGGGSSTASSRDASPCRDLSPLINSLNAPIIVRRGPRGFGFTIRAIRVYFGDTDIYTVHHLVMEVDKGSPAFDAGLRPGDLVTHINGEPVQGLMHTQVLQLLISGGEAVTLRATALETTSIKTGGRRRDPQAIKMAKRSKRSGGGGGGKARRPHHHHGDHKTRKTSLFRKLSSKKATAEMQQLAAAQSGNSGNSPGGMMRQTSAPGTPSPLASASITMSDSGHSDCSSSTCSPADSSPCSPAAGGASSSSPSARPSSLHGLKHKLHVKTKTLHSPNRRHSHSGHIPLSPLARTPSPSPVPVSPTRSPSPLALPLTQHHVHPAGSSNTTQTYSPGASLTPNSAKKAFNAHRPKSAEPGSPLLRRALSPDRLHPRSDVKVKGTISPLCNPPPKLTVATGSQQQAITSRSGEVLSPLPSRATHTSPSTAPKTSSVASESGNSTPSSQEAMIRKHSKSSLSQPTIPEEETEEPEEQQPPPVQPPSDSNLAGISKPEDIQSSSKGGREKEKESTLQRMTKAIRGTSRSDSRSKKNREASTSPNSKSSGVSRKDSLKKSAAEKRDMFKTLH